MKLGFDRTLKITTTFYLNLCLVISSVVVAIYFGIFLRNQRLLMDGVKQEARSYYDLIVRVRRWNADYGGVYVEKRGGVTSNPYLRGMGVEPDIVARDGRVFTLRNPALMTKELSTIVNGASGVRFHITSLQLVNKENAPDAFETAALKKFEAGAREDWTVEKGPQGTRFRYMAPLQVEQSCQECHSSFHYTVGEIRGGISITLPLQKLERELALNRWAIIILSLLTLALLLGYTYLMLSQLVQKIEAAQLALREASVTDELTGLRNRRFLMSRFEEEIKRARRTGSYLGLLLIDLDFFKQVNDTRGHPFGDLVLTAVARAIANMLREYDIASRYGGEEFAVVASVASDRELVALAERIRQRIEALPIEDRQFSIRVTLSIGATGLHEVDTLESMLKRADDALYRAKKEGRNRTVFA